jgi:hypothetical protein
LVLKKCLLKKKVHSYNKTETFVCCLPLFLRPLFDRLIIRRRRLYYKSQKDPGAAILSGPATWRCARDWRGQVSAMLGEDTRSVSSSLSASLNDSSDSLPAAASYDASMQLSRLPSTASISLSHALLQHPDFQPRLSAPAGKVHDRDYPYWRKIIMTKAGRSRAH